VRINVTKSFLPPKAEYEAYLSKIWDNAWLTNNGPLLVELEKKIQEYTGIENFAFVGNGTIAIQIAIKALALSGEIITTPFSYCATTTSILWENLKPVFVDINAHDFNINADLIEAAITEKTSAILATHVYGFPCEVEKIEKIAQKYSLKVIYDAAHAFGVTVNGKSLLAFGDVATCSFHSTKVFHTVEGGGIISNNKAIFEKTKLIRSFGHKLDDYYLAGINGKNSEFHAAMGLCNLNHLDYIFSGRKAVFELYDNGLKWLSISKPHSKNTGFKTNYAYYPIVFENEQITNTVIAALESENIFPRRYFFPSLNKLPYLKNQNECPISEKVALNVISLPLYPDLEHKIVSQIIEIINSCI
jgi:dTDP-4-amino-4,6-dideoxygalactose transaminase